MEDDGSTAQESTARAQIARLIRFIGMLDVVFGIVIAVGGPRFVGSDPSTDLLLPIAGGVIALGGVAVWWYGRFVYNRRFLDRIDRPTVQHR